MSLKIIPRKRGLKEWLLLPGSIVECNFRYHKRDKFMGKFIILDTRKRMQGVGNSLSIKKKNDRLSSRTLGAINNFLIPSRRKGGGYYADPIYFCLIILNLGDLTVDTVTHESVHAGYAYSYRSPKKAPHGDKNHEENVCYPAGFVSELIENTIRKYRLRSFKLERWNGKVTLCSNL